MKRDRRRHWGPHVKEMKENILSRQEKTERPLRVENKAGHYKGGRIVGLQKNRNKRI